MRNNIFKSALSLGLSALLSISGGGIYPQNQVVRADEVYFESKIIQDSDSEMNYNFDETNEIDETESSSQAVEVQNSAGVTVGPFTVDGGTQGTEFDYASSVLTIHSGDLTISTNGETTERIVVDGAATITFAGVNISTAAGSALQIQDNATFNVNILLADGSNNILKTTASNYAGLQKNGSGASIGTLTIGVPDGSAGTGKLEATGGQYGAGIGGEYTGSASNITISGGVVTATGGQYGADIGGGRQGDGSNITITGGEVTATGGSYGAGIGGGNSGSGSNITITGGVVTATGGYHGAGIGGGRQGSGSDITINGGEVTANGGSSGAGIGGGRQRSGSDITIDGGLVTANGGQYGAGIGDGYYPSASGSGNSLNGDAVVLATSGHTTRPALEGFVDDRQESLLTQGIAFTGLGTAFDSYGHATDVTWDSNGTMYGNVALSQDLEIPANLTIPAGQILSIKEGKDVTLSEEDGAKYTVEGELRNNGTVTLPADLAFSDNGKVTTKTDFYREGSTDVYATGYQTYQTNEGQQKYKDLPNPDESNGSFFNGWYTESGGKGTKVDETVDVLLNHHDFYEYRLNEKYTITIDQIENGTITPDVTEAEEGDEIGFTITPDDGYELKDGSVKVTDENGNEVPVTEKDGKYTFIMPGSGVKIDAIFELIPSPEPTPSPTPTNEINGGSFSWDVLEYDTSVTPTPTDQVEKIDTKTLKDIQKQIPQNLKTNAYVIGYGDGTFKPENNITRAEAAQMVYKLIYNGTKVNYDALQKFSDVNQTAWYSTAVAYLTDQGLIDGDGGKFYSNRQITRAEMSKILYNALLKYDKDQEKKLVYGTSSFNFTDVSNNCSFEPIKQLATNNMINGYGDGTFKSNQNITRAETVAIISKVFARSQEFSQRLSFKDVSPNHWAYKYIMNAVNGEN